MRYPQLWRRVAASIPIFQWSRSYDLPTGLGDLIAGITIALTLIPQSIAYASLAGFEPQYGLYASLTGGFVYGLLGTCPQINVGPTALLSLLTFTYTNGSGPDFAILLCFIGGIVQIVAGISQLGFLVDFVSLPVVSGFTSAAAITIASSQIKGLLGLSFNADNFIGTWKGLYQHIGDTRLPDTLLSLVCCIVLLGMKAIKDIRIKDAVDEKNRGKVLALKRSLWFTGVARNAVVVVLAAVLAYFVHQDEKDPLILTGKITAGLPTPQPPPFQSTVGNEVFSFTAMLSKLGSGLIVVPLVGIISNVAIAKAFARGKTLDATQEIVALGVCNVVGAFFRSFPVNGSFTRSAVSDASGVKTPAAGFYTGIIVLLTLALLTPYFYFIPRAALSSVIVCAVLPMVDLDIIKKLWKTSRLDLIPLLGTFVCCLALGIEVGLVCGVAVDMLLLLYYHSRPPLDVEFVDDGNLPPHYAIHPVGGLHFASAEKFQSKLATLKNAKYTSDVPLETLTVIPDFDYINNGTLREDGTRVGENGSGMSENGTRITENGLGVCENGSRMSEYGTRIRENEPRLGQNGTRVGENDTQIVVNGVSVVTNVVDIVRNVENNMTRRKSTNILVVYCDGLYRLDYTFLQSLKMAVSGWSRSGRVLWCDTKPSIKYQLDSVLHEPVYCTTEELPILLADPARNTVL